MGVEVKLSAATQAGLEEFKTSGLMEIYKESKMQRHEEIKSIYAEAYPEYEVTREFAKMYDAFAQECAVCETCTGESCKKSVMKYFRYKVKPEPTYHQMVFKSYHCGHWYKLRQKKLLLTSKIPTIYQNKTWEDFEVDSNNENAYKWSRYVLEKDSKQWLYFYGTPGTGKTFLASLIAQDFLRQGRSVLFIDVPSLLNTMRSSFSKDNDGDIEEMMSELAQVDVLLLDDLGTELCSAWAIERLYTIINDRYSKDKQTVITSNYDLTTLSRRLNTPAKTSSKYSAADGVPEISGDRIASRIKQMCKMTKLQGEDRRLQ